MELKATKGTWYIERTSDENGDFQARILSNIGKVFHAGEEKEQIMIIVGEPSKRNGQANIHCVANALLISQAPEMFKMLERIYEKKTITFDDLIRINKLLTEVTVSHEP